MTLRRFRRTDLRAVLRVRSLPLCLLIAVSLLGACGRDPNEVAAATESDKPNIVLILLDDLGYNDLGANGNPEINTPNLDRLAGEGVRFTRHYTDSTCTATRVGIMTGMSPARQGFRPDNIGLSPELTTLPEMLREVGYTTHHIGKWHLGFVSKLAWPTRQGFDSFFGFLNQFLLKNTMRNGEWAFSRPSYHNPWLQEDEQPPRLHKGHLSAILADRAVAFIENRQPGDAPWFLNFWSYAPHHPIQPMEEFAQRYPDDPAGRYRALVEQMDATVGRIVDALDAKGLADNTLLLVASDNGGTNRQIDNNAPFFGTKASFYEGGLRTPMLLRWPGKVPAGMLHEEIVSNFDYLPTFAKASGAKAPPGFIGSDLVALVLAPQNPRPALYWEIGNSHFHSWSALSEGGRWRLTQDIAGPPKLFDLDARPAGDLNVAKDYPQIVSQLGSSFLNWRLQQRKVDFHFEQKEVNGRGELTGKSFERAPGFAGHTFAIGVTPENRVADNEQIIALGPGQWQLSQLGDKLIVTINKLRLEAPSPPAGRCSSIIVGSHFGDMVLYRKSKRAVIEIFINTERVGQLVTSDFEFPADDFLSPTYIGQDTNGRRLYRGQLSPPAMLNERLLAVTSSNTSIANGVDTIQHSLCPPMAGPANNN